MNAPLASRVRQVKAESPMGDSSPGPRRVFHRHCRNYSPPPPLRIWPKPAPHLRLFHPDSQP